MDTIEPSHLIEGIRRLQQIRERLLAGELSPEGAWIHEYEVRRFYPGSGNTEWYRYAKWQAHEPIFQRRPKGKWRWGDLEAEPGLTKHQHIGRVSSTTGLQPEADTLDAYQAWRNRQKLEAVETALKEIQVIVAKFEPKPA